MGMPWKHNHGLAEEKSKQREFDHYECPCYKAAGVKNCRAGEMVACISASCLFCCFKSDHAKYTYVQIYYMSY